MGLLPDSEQALSEAIGAVVLIGIIATVMAFAGMMVLSQPQPQSTPALSAVISSSNQTVAIHHNGGDSFSFSDLQILLDGADYTSEFRNDGVAVWSTWSIGQSLTYEVPESDPLPTLIQVVYKGHRGAPLVIAASGEGSLGAPLPAPVVTGITPNSGPVDTVVSITNLAGSGFKPGATVKLTKAGSSDISGTSVTVVSAAQITCQFDLAGAANGPWTVVVTNPDTQSGALTDGFTVVAPAPTVTGITPASAESGTVVSITNLAGTGFGYGATVKLTKAGSSDISGTAVNVVSATQITCQFNLAGASTGTWNVIVTNTDLQSGTLINGFTVTSPPAPTLAGITPAAGVAGASVSVTNLSGTNFQTGTTPTVWLAKTGATNVTATSVVVVSATQITCTLPLPAPSSTSAGQWTVVMKNADGQSSNPLTNAFTVTNPAPTLSSITPNTGVAGMSVSVTNLTGTNFQTGTTPTVWLAKTGATNVTATSVVVVSASQITCTLPLPAPSSTSAGQWTVVMKNADGQSSNPLTNGFTVTNPQPTVTGITPNYGLRGQTVSVTDLAGTNFVTGTTPSVWLYEAGQTNITGTGVNVVSSTQITNTFAIPSNALMTQWDVVVINADGTPASGGTNLFTIRRPLRITSVSPSVTAKNKAVTVTIDGEGFIDTGTTGVVFTRNGTATTVTGTSVTYIAETQITAYFNKPVNSNGVYYDVTVTNPPPDSQVAFYPRGIVTG